MTSKITIILFVLMLAVSSCHKCETCIPYHYSNGVLGTIDSANISNPSSNNVNGGAQSIKLCDERDIKAYESLTTFSDGASSADTVRYICQ